MLSTPPPPDMPHNRTCAGRYEQIWMKSWRLKIHQVLWVNGNDKCVCVCVSVQVTLRGPMLSWYLVGDTASRLHSGTLSEALHLDSGWKTVSWKCIMTPQVLTQLKWTFLWTNKSWLMKYRKLQVELRLIRQFVLSFGFFLFVCF